MAITPMRIPDAFLITPDRHTDDRGVSYEVLRESELSRVTGHPFTAVQANYSVSRRNTLRGIHATALPPGQAKVVTCVRGAVRDVVVDLRVGAATFGTCEVNDLDESSGAAVFLADGLGHAFLALTDDACVGYLCSTKYVPGTMIDINPLDPDLCLPWSPADPLILSEKDRTAPMLADAVRAGLVPTYDECVASYRT